MGLTVALLGLAVAVELPILIDVIAPHLGDDSRFYRDIGARWLADGTYYLPHQLAGPYTVTLQLDNLYPPHALALFVPFTVLPAVFWWVIPLGVTAYVLAGWRPAWWSWPLVALLVVWPRTLGSVLWGNMDMWMMAGVASGLRWGWPALVLTVKPSLVPFALVGAGRRSFWLGSAVAAVISLPMLPLWADYITAMRNLTIAPDYSLGSIPMMLLPLVAWLGRSADHRRPGVAGSGSPADCSRRPPVRPSVTRASGPDRAPPRVGPSG